MKRRNEQPAQPLRLSPADVIAATLVIDGTIWALLDTAPLAAAELDADKPFEQRMRLGSRSLSPHVEFTAEEWERMSLEHASVRRTCEYEHLGRGALGPKPRTAGDSPAPAVRGLGFRSVSR
jgi:hypothetical protein